ncbi:DUF2339 domain-containing protein [Rhodobacter sp. NTK016B]|uniref:DUF2339 domain-containing protein n=1 Tax=Rhodobacter sp. NTK016B TaxID=2759676 RepID=UPI001A903B57|nr:DUF2339 domain-containing protein [Rhodobacter sp. NTK016B]MBN8293804.1 DUF2339 domain-containing protein [Rhodobacter sp. NTK016B]
MRDDLTILFVLLLGLALALAFRRLRALESRVRSLEAQARRTPAATDEREQGGPLLTPAAASRWPLARSDDEVRPEESGPPARPSTPALPVLRQAMRRAMDWLRANWIYPVAGTALIMAAIYLVQYSIEKGLLSPAARIALAVVLGTALIAGAEALRRRWGDGETGARLVPATLAGAGVVALFAAVLAAFHLYAMLGQIGAFAALAAIAAFAMALGWVHGPLLAAIGVIGGCAAPFLLGGGSAPGAPIFGYFLILSLLGQGIDGYRRWGWVSILAVLLPLGGGWLMAQAGGPGWALAAMALGIAVLALALPGGTLIPQAEGPMPHRWRQARPSLAVLAGTLAVLGALLAILSAVRSPESLMAIGIFAVILPIWTRRAPAFASLALPVAAAIPVAVGVSLMTTPLFLSFVLNAKTWSVVTTLTLSVLAGAAMLWRSEDNPAQRSYWGILAIVTPGATAIAIELFWRPLTLLPLLWPFAVMAHAGAASAVAIWAARRDQGQGARLGAALVGTYTMIALAMTLLISEAALSMALAVLLVSAGAMDRRFNLPALGWVMGLGALALGWRLMLVPGLGPLLDGEVSTLDVWLTFVAVLAGPLAALALIRSLTPHPARDWGRVVAETTLSASVPVVLMVIFGRFLDGISAHAGLGIEASVLIAMAWVQAERAERLSSSRAMLLVRRILCWGLGIAAAFCLWVGAVILSPVVGFGSSVSGWPILNDLALAYGAPALLLWWTFRKQGGKRGLLGRLTALALLGIWIATVIRHLWHGSAGMTLDAGFLQGELYAYTLALLAAGAVAMAVALRTGRHMIRVAGLALIGVAAAKAFLIDASGLSGLMRVGAFLGLGLSLVALAWLNAWVTARMPKREPKIAQPD